MFQLLYITLILQCCASVRLFSNSKINKVNIEFFHGSNIKSSFYLPFLNELQNSYKLKFSTPNYITWPFFPENTILIGHSFGGTICLLYYMIEKLMGTSNIKACILINSHFNQREVMPYPKIDILSIRVPVLTILTDNDEKLPLSKAMDDAIYVKENNISNKIFFIVTGNHTSCFTDLNNNDTIDHIKKFLFDLNQYKDKLIETV